MYGGRAPAFASDDFQLPYLDLEEYHLTEQALRRLLRQVRKQLQQTDAYDGSKLQQLDSFEVKLSQLSTSKIVIRPGIHEPTKAQRTAWDNRNAAKEPAAKKKRGRPARAAI
jgi:hypothetical protein